jgi:hypothetical protein
MGGRLPAGRADDVADRRTTVRFSGRLPAPGWESRYRWAVIGSDLLATVLAMALVGWLLVPINGHRIWSAVDLAVLTMLVVTAAIALNRGWHPSVLGQGAEEFRRLGRGMAAALVVLVLAGLAGGLADMRPWVFAVVPAIAVLALAQRYQLRRFLHRARKTGHCLLPVLVAGGQDSVLDLIGRTRRAAHLGWRVEAACTAGTGRAGGVLGGVPVIGGLPDVARHVVRGRYRIVAVTPDAYWTPTRLRQLAWDLEGSDTEMVVAPVLMEVAGPRVHVTGVLGMPLLRVAAPAFTGTRRWVKEIVDRVGAALSLLVTWPLLLGIAVAVVVDSRGGVLQPQGRPWVHHAEVPHDDAGRRGRDPGRRVPAPLVAGRTAAVAQRARRVDVHGRATTAAARRDDPLRAGRAAAAAGQAGAHRTGTGERARRADHRRGGPPGPALRRGLVARAGRADPLEDGACRGVRRGQ